MRISATPLVVLLAFAGCTGTDELPVSEKADPQVNLTPPPLDVNEGWPCPPFDDVETTEDKVGDSDADSLTDCQEEYLGSNPNDVDSDGDGVGDFFEIGEIAEPRDTDGDGIFDLIDDDDDNDGVLTVDEVENAGDNPRDYDYPDGDGVANYLDNDEDNDRLFGQDEGRNLEFPDGNRDGDADEDGIPNWADNDDDNDGACCGDEDTDGNLTAANDDTDGDGKLDWEDDDDDGDGVPTIDEDWNGTGNPMDDNIDGDGYSDYQDIDEDGDSLLNCAYPNHPDADHEDLDNDGDPTDEDTDGDGIPNFRDSDDDGDGVPTRQEDEDALLPQPTTGAPDGLGVLTDDDTDGDTIPNYLDDNDDGDACLTIQEDADGAQGPINDDANANGIPDFLDPEVAECTPGETTFRIDLDGTGFDAGLDGVTVYAVVLDGAEATISSQDAVLAAGAFSLTFPDMISSLGTYSIDLFVDADADGACATGTGTGTLPAEDSYRITGITSAGETVTATVDAATDPVEPDACLTFP